MREPAPDSTQIKCHGCSRMVIVPAGRVRSASRARRSYVVFCSRRCNLHHVAVEGTRQQAAKVVKDA